MPSTTNPVTISSLIKQDLPQAYFQPAWPSSYGPKEYKFLNDKKYRVFDHPAYPLSLLSRQIPWQLLITAGSEVPFLLDTAPPEYLTSHWKKWIPQFAPATIKPIEEGLADEVRIVTLGALQCIPAKKHAVHPDMHYKLQLKSTIQHIKVPFPRYMSESEVTFPCLLKVDQSWGGHGHRKADTPNELQTILTDLRENLNWNGGYVLQEYIAGVKSVPGSTFYLNKAGEVTWLGTDVGGYDEHFKVTSMILDWDQQEELRESIYDEFVIPIKNYLHNRGYFGFVIIEVMITEHGRYLCDINTRASVNTCQLLIAPFMAEKGYTKSTDTSSQEPFKFGSERLVAKANEINSRDAGIVLIQSVLDRDDAPGCIADFLVFAKSHDEVQALSEKLANA